MAGLTGTVIGVDAKRSIVRLDGTGEAVVCSHRGRLGRGPRRERNVLAVGDRVSLSLEGDEGVVTDVLPRENELSRLSGTRPIVRHVFAANVDRVFIVSAWREPPMRTGFIDRCLAAALASHIDATILVTKEDLLDEEERSARDEVVAVYRDAGFDVFTLSTLEPESLERVVGRLCEGTSVLVGQSGVGKSSLLNAVEPGLELETGEVSEATNKGRHTTTRSRLIALECGGYVVDSPGVRSFGLEPLTLPQLLLAYPEFAPFGSECRYTGCTHVHEPKCRVREAVEEGAIAEWRYDNYVRILESLG